MRVVHFKLLTVIFAGLLTSLMSGRFKCGALSCGRTFDSSSALLRHRPSCIHHRQESVSRASLQHKHPLLHNIATNPVSKKAKSDEVNVLELPWCVASHFNCVSQNSADSVVAKSTTGPRDEVPTGSPILLSVGDLAISNLSSGTQAVATESNLPVSGELGSVPEGSPKAPGNLGRPERSRQLPVRFRDVLLEPFLPYSPGLESSETSPQPILPRVILHVFDSFRTCFNAFHIVREYHHRLSYDPDSFLTMDQLTNTSPNPSSAGAPLPPDISPPPPPPWPWNNMGVW
jgi:hypothetical protein